MFYYPALPNLACLYAVLIVCAPVLFRSVSSGSDSDSDDSEKNNTESELPKLNKPSGNDEGADSGNSTVAEDEDDFNPFGMSGSDDEG